MMWDFNFNKLIKDMAATSPFIIFRMIVYFTIAIAYTIATGVGIFIGHLFHAAGWGGLIAFCIVSGVLYWLREYTLYLIKAGHIAVLVERVNGNEIPEGKNQIQHARAVVKERFAEASVLFGIDQLIKGILKAVNAALFSIADFLPIPGLDQAAGFVVNILNVSLSYVDEIILAYNMRNVSGADSADNPWASSREAVILYAQNYKIMLKNAVFIFLLMYACALCIFVVFLLPAAAVAALLPGSAGAWAVVAAGLFAWCCKAALLEPMAVGALMQVYFKTIEGQAPNPDWDEKLSAVSDKFTELKQRAMNSRPAQAESAMALEG